MPWTINNPPRAAKNWTQPQKKKCVAAANAVLKRGGSDRDAVFACINAAGKSQRKQVDDDAYDEASSDAAQAFKVLVAAYFAGRILLSQLDADMRSGLRDHFTRMMLLGLGARTPTQRDLDMLERFLAREYLYLDGFIDDLQQGRMTELRAGWRAGLYGYSRHVFIAYTVPIDVAMLMPFLPGEDCLGGDLCHCHLEVVYDDDGTANVYWVLDPASESCEVCIGHQLESPFVFTAEQQQNA